MREQYVGFACTVFINLINCVIFINFTLDIALKLNAFASAIYAILYDDFQ